MADIRQRIESALNQLTPYLLKKTLQTLEVDTPTTLEKSQLVQSLITEILEAGIQGLFNRLQKQTLKKALNKFNIPVPPDCDLEEAQIQLEQLFLQQTLQKAFAQCGEELLKAFCSDLKIIPQQVATELGISTDLMSSVFCDKTHVLLKIRRGSTVDRTRMGS